MPRQSRRTLLLTRPEAASARFAAQARARFGQELRVVISPVLHPVFLTPETSVDTLGGVIFSSETGVEGFCRAFAARGLPAWCVGPRTAEAARNAGFDSRVAGGDAQALVALLLSERPQGPLLHARGRDTTGNLARDLRMGGLDATEAVVYVQEAQPLSDEARRLLAGRAEVLLPVFSPRSAQLLAAQLDRSTRAPILLAALSPAVARLASALPALRRETADSPDAGGMLNALARLLGAEAKACAGASGD
jgi:uroporphyrinogen-III synthase